MDFQSVREDKTKKVVDTVKEYDDFFFFVHVNYRTFICVFVCRCFC